jgi:hypothetical protein
MWETCECKELKKRLPRYYTVLLCFNLSKYAMNDLEARRYGVDKSWGFGEKVRWTLWMPHQQVGGSELYANASTYHCFSMALLQDEHMTPVNPSRHAIYVGVQLSRSTTTTARAEKLISYRPPDSCRSRLSLIKDGGRHSMIQRWPGTTGCVTVDEGKIGGDDGSKVGTT